MPIKKSKSYQIIAGDHVSKTAMSSLIEVMILMSEIVLFVRLGMR